MAGCAAMLEVRVAMNETIKAVGGGGVSADPVVSAVLNAVGKRYLVEIGENDEGFKWERYSDGFKRVTIHKWFAFATHTVTFPIEFESVPRMFASFDANSQSSPHFYDFGYNVTTTGFTLVGIGGIHNYVIEGV